MGDVHVHAIIGKVIGEAASLPAGIINKPQLRATVFRPAERSEKRVSAGQPRRLPNELRARIKLSDPAILYVDRT